MKRLLTLISVIALALTLTFIVSGCAGSTDDLEGKNVVTFKVNGGVLNYGTSSTKTSVNFAYYPGTYILDPAKDIPNYSLSRSGYDFTGWYTDISCEPEFKWDFKTPFDVPMLTLYAGWEKSIKYTYSVYYVEESNGTPVKLGDYNALAGGTFDDWKDVAELREGYTCIGYYSDKELTTLWDNDYAHPGGEVDLDIPVYAKYIEGEWELVSNYSELKRAINVGGNVYLTSNIDCEGKEFYVATNFSGIFNGNGYTISNFTVPKKGSPPTPTAAIFKGFTATAEVVDVSFENVAYDFTGIAASEGNITVNPKVAALAIDMQAGATVKNVTVTGTLTTNYSGELSCVNSVYFFEETVDATVMAGVENFNAQVTVTQQQ